MPSNPSSTCATDGGSVGRYVLILPAPLLTSLLPSLFHLLKKPSSQLPAWLTQHPNRSPSNKSSAYDPVEQRNLVAYRISRYLSNPDHSYVQHRKASSQDVKAQTNFMGSYLQAFDDTMKLAGNDTIRQAEKWVLWQSSLIQGRKEVISKGTQK
jgi:hypothetical protein